MVAPLGGGRGRGPRPLPGAEEHAPEAGAARGHLRPYHATRPRKDDPTRHYPRPSDSGSRPTRTTEVRPDREEPWPATRQIVVKSTAWQYFTTIKVPVERVGLIIGRGGRTIQQIEEVTQARISVNKMDGSIDIRAGDIRSLETARERVNQIADRPLGRRRDSTATVTTRSGPTVSGSAPGLTRS